MPPTIKKWKYDNIAELLSALGGISPDRVCANPPPGTATRSDLLRKDGKGKRYELVKRTLVEKPMGFPESFLALELAYILRCYLEENDAGFLCGPDVLIRLFLGLVRSPDLCFVAWTLRPDKTVPREPISRLIPELVVEVLSPSNTAKEMQRKRKEYFQAGVRVVWMIDPENYKAEVYTDPDTTIEVPETGTLDGGEILPGFQLSLKKLFSRLERPA